MPTVLRPLYRLVWSDPGRRARKLLQFAEVEADGGRDLVRAAELTADPRLRRRYLTHAADETRHAALFRRRGLDVRAALDAGTRPRGEWHPPDWFAPGERGLDDLRVERQDDAALLAFLHLSESAAARSFAIYRDVLAADPQTRAVFDRILKDEEGHMRYTLAELDRVSAGHRRRHIWRARLGRIWKAYLRIASAIAGVLGGIMLTLQYLLLLPPFAWLARRAARRTPPGWVTPRQDRAADMRRQY